MNSLLSYVTDIEPLDVAWKERAHEYLETLAIPHWSLGVVMDIAKQLAAIQKTLKPTVENKCVILMAGDHGVVEEGVSACKKEVTIEMIDNLSHRGASINALADTVHADVMVVDVGVAVDLDDYVKQGTVIPWKIGYGTRNMKKGPAMTREEAKKSILVGIKAVEKAINEKSAQLIATGDLGIGNTTPSSAILSVMTGQKVADVTGRGTGIDDKRLNNKIKVIEKAIELNKPDPNDPIDVLSKVGGYEIGGIAGVILGCAHYRIPVIVDGLISTAGALIAYGLNCNTVDYMIAGHKSQEPGHNYMWKSLNLKPLLDLGFRLGEGTGAALAMNIVEGAAAVINNVLSYEAAGVTPGA